MQLLTIFSAFCARLSSYSCSRSWTKKKDKNNYLWNYVEEETYPACHIDVRLHFKHHLNLMLVTELQHFQNNSIAKQVFILPIPSLLVAGQAPVISGHLTLVATYENHSHKRPAPVTNTFFASRGCPLTRASTVFLNSFITNKPNLFSFFFNKQWFICPLPEPQRSVM